MPSSTVKLDNFIREATTKIFVNKYLEEYQGIISFLNQNDIHIDELFGSEDTKLEVFLISFGGSVDLNTFKFIINGLRNFKPQYVKVVPEIYGKNSIYIGSYAYRGDKEETIGIALLNDNIVAKINGSRNIQEAYNMVLENMNQVL